MADKTPSTEVVLHITQAAPLTGAVVPADGYPQEFEGWLEMMRVIAGVIDSPAPFGPLLQEEAEPEADTGQARALSPCAGGPGRAAEGEAPAGGPP